MWIAIGTAAGFVLGLVFHRYVLAEAQSVKKYVTDEFNKLRQDLGVAIGGAQKK